MSSHRIRPAITEDASAIARITNRYIETAIHFGYQPETAAELEAQRAAATGRYPWLVAVDADGGVIGYARGREWRSRDAYRWTTEVGIYLDPAHTGAGVGRALYAALLDELIRAGFHSAVGGITLPNPASVALHRALGFLHVGTVRDAGWKHGAWHDVAFYQRLLQPSATPPAPAATVSRST